MPLTDVGMKRVWAELGESVVQAGCLETSGCSRWEETGRKTQMWGLLA